MRRRGDYQLALWTAAAGADPGACSQQVPIRVTPILATVQTTQATVLPQSGVANAFAAGAEGSPLVFQEQAPRINATCAPYQAFVQPSVVGAGQIEYQRDMFEMSQGRA